MNIIKNTASVTHNTSVRNHSIDYEIIHYTATDKATGANEIKYFSRKTTRNASADFFVDGYNVYQYNPDPLKRYCWAVGGKKLNTAGGSMYGKITNRNSISIEMCCYKENGVWKISDATYQTTIELARYLKKLYNLPAGRIYRHYDVTGKLCPNVEGFISPDTRWQAMKAAIDAGRTAQSTSTAQQTSQNTSAAQQASAKTAQTTSHRFNLSVDGSLGPASVRAMQTWLGTTVDGVVSGQYINNRKYLSACPSGTWQYVYHPTGSAMIKALQRTLGVSADGICGPGTVRAIQRMVGTTQDGYLGRNTAKALQRYLNSL